MYKVSVIVPIYKVERFIVRCAESLFNQTLDDMQFIFVDDASPDNSVALLEQTLERFPRRKSQTIILHHSGNLGLPTSRATGMAYVEAPYVAHCDSDDYMEPSMFAKLYENAVQNDSDMVICGWKTHYANGKVVTVFDNPEPRDNMILRCLYKRFSSATWHRLTRTDIYRRVIFPKGNFFEDQVQTVQLLTYVKRVSFVDEALYHYDRRNPGSIMSERSIALDRIKESVRQSMADYALMHDFLMRHCQLEEKDFVLRKNFIRNIWFPYVSRWSVRKKYLQTFPELNIRILFNRMIPWRSRAIHLLILLGLYSLLKPVYDIFKKLRMPSKRKCERNVKELGAMKPA